MESSAESFKKVITNGKWVQYLDSDETDYVGCYTTTSFLDEGVVREDMYRITFGGKVFQSTSEYVNVIHKVDGHDFVVKESVGGQDSRLIGSGNIKDNNVLEIYFIGSPN